MQDNQWPQNLLLDNGQPVTLPIIVDESYVNHWEDESFTNEMHHSHNESISSSNLKKILVSPYNYIEHLKRTQNGYSPKKNKSMTFGTIAHLVVLEPHKFRKRVVMAPAFKLNTNEGKAGWETFKADHAPDAIIFRDIGDGRNEYDELVGVVNAITSHPKIRDVFAEGIFERTGFFRCPRTGILSRIRPDFMATNIEGGHLVDFKTTQSTIYEIFRKQAENLWYPLQKSMYRTGYKEINGNFPAVASWVTVENNFPYEAAIFPVDVEMITYGDNWYFYAMDLLKECIIRKQFPQRQRVAETMIPSDYAMAKRVPSIQEYAWEH